MSEIQRLCASWDSFQSLSVDSRLENGSAPIVEGSRRTLTVLTLRHGEVVARNVWAEMTPTETAGWCAKKPS